MARRPRILSVLPILLVVGGPLKAPQPPTRAVPAGLRGPAPVLQAAAKAIGADQLKCVTISGTGYAGMVGQQRLNRIRMWIGRAANRWPITRGP